MVASFLGFATALFLGFLGLIGIASWDEVSDPWGVGALVLAVLLALASWGLLRGSRAARLVVALLAIVGGVAAIVFVFTGPAGATGPGLVTLAAAAVLVWLLYGARGARAYFGS